MGMLWVGPYLLTAVVGHSLLCRSSVRLNSVSGFLVVGGGVGLALGVHLWFLAGVGVTTFAALAAYAFACELYLFLFTMVGSSVSARLLLTLRRGGRVESELAELYRPADMVAGRIQRLRAVGFLAADGSVSPKGRVLLRGFRWLRGFFGMPAFTRG